MMNEKFMHWAYYCILTMDYWSSALKWNASIDMHESNHIKRKKIESIFEVTSNYFTSVCNSLCMFTLSSYWIPIFNVHHFPFKNLLDKTVLYDLICVFFLRSLCMHVLWFLDLASIKHTKDRWQRTCVYCRYIKSFEILSWLSCLLFFSATYKIHMKNSVRATHTDLTAIVSKARWIFSICCVYVWKSWIYISHVLNGPFVTT